MESDGNNEEGVKGNEESEYDGTEGRKVKVRGRREITCEERKMKGM